MTLLKTSFLSFISTIIKMISALVINKAVSIYIGPSGLALIGNFQNFNQILMVLGQFGINNGVTKYTAEYKKNSPRNLKPMFTTSLWISSCSSIVVSFLILIFSESLATIVLLDVKFNYIYEIFALTLILFVINNLLLSIINGLKDIKLWFKVNVLQSIFSLILTLSLIFYLGLGGALISIVTNQSIVFFILVFMLNKNSELKLNLFIGTFNAEEGKKLVKFAVMGFLTIVTLPVSLLIIRNSIGDNIGWQEAGYWQALWYISTMYLMVITTSLSVYYLPKLSEIENPFEVKKEIFQCYKLIIPFLILVISMLYYFKDIVLTILFSDEFKSVSDDVFLYQLFGDFVKVMAWVFSYIMLAKAMTKEFVVTQILFSISFVLLSVFLIQKFGLKGVSIAYFVNYIFYLVTCVFLTRKFWKFN